MKIWIEASTCNVSKISIHAERFSYALKGALMRMRAFGCFASSSRYVTALGSVIPPCSTARTNGTQPNLRPRHCILYCAHYLNERNFAVILPPSNPRFSSPLLIAVSPSAALRADCPILGGRVTLNFLNFNLSCLLIVVSKIYLNNVYFSHSSPHYRIKK